MSDMRTLIGRDLNRKTANVLDAVERGEVFEIRRNGPLCRLPNPHSSCARTKA